MMQRSLLLFCQLFAVVSLMHGQQTTHIKPIDLFVTSGFQLSADVDVEGEYSFKLFFPNTSDPNKTDTIIFSINPLDRYTFVIRLKDEMQKRNKVKFEEIFTPGSDHTREEEYLASIYTNIQLSYSLQVAKAEKRPAGTLLFASTAPLYGSPWSETSINSLKPRKAFRKFNRTYQKFQRINYGYQSEVLSRQLAEILRAAGVNSSVYSPAYLSTFFEQESLTLSNQSLDQVLTELDKILDGFSDMKGYDLLNSEVYTSVQEQLCEVMIEWNKKRNLPDEPKIKALRDNLKGLTATKPNLENVIKIGNATFFWGEVYSEKRYQLDSTSIQDIIEITESESGENSLIYLGAIDKVHYFLKDPPSRFDGSSLDIIQVKSKNSDSKFPLKVSKKDLDTLQGVASTKVLIKKYLEIDKQYFSLDSDKKKMQYFDTSSTQESIKIAQSVHGDNSLIYLGHRGSFHYFVKDLPTSFTGDTLDIVKVESGSNQFPLEVPKDNLEIIQGRAFESSTIMIEESQANREKAMMRVSDLISTLDQLCFHLRDKNLFQSKITFQPTEKVKKKQSPPRAKNSKGSEADESSKYRSSLRQAFHRLYNQAKSEPYNLDQCCDSKNEINLCDSLCDSSCEKVERGLLSLRSQLISEQGYAYQLRIEQIQAEFKEGYLENIQVIGKPTMISSILHHCLCKDEVACSTPSKDNDKNEGEAITNPCESKNTSNNLKTILEEWVKCNPRIKEILEPQEFFEFTNFYAIGFSRKKDEKRSQQAWLWDAKRTSVNAHHIDLQDVLTNYFEVFAVGRRDYSPKDTVFTIQPSKTNKITLHKEARIKFLETEIYSDFRGFSDEAPNGLIQLELSKRIPITTHRIQIPKLKPGRNVGFTQFLNPAFALSKIEKDDFFLGIKYKDRFVNGEYNPLKFNSAIDLIRYQNLSLGFDQNLILIDVPGGKAQWTLDFGVRFGRTSLSDTLRNLQDGEIQPTNAINEITVFSSQVSPVVFNYRQEYEETIEIHMSWNPLLCYFLRSNEIQTVANDDFFVATEDSRIRGITSLPFFGLNTVRGHYLSQVSLKAIYKPHQNKGNKFFFRYTLTWQHQFWRTTFSQVQVGYSANINAFRSGP